MAQNAFGVETGNQSSVNQNMSPAPVNTPSNPFAPPPPSNYTPGTPAPPSGGHSGGGGGGGNRRRNNNTPHITNPMPDLTPVPPPAPRPITPAPVNTSGSIIIMQGGMSADPNRGVVPIASTVGGNTLFYDRPSGASFEVGPTASPTPFSPSNQLPMSVAPINPFWTTRSPNTSYADGGAWETDAKAESQTYAIENDRSWWQRRSQEAGERAARVQANQPTPEFGTGVLREYKSSAWEKYAPMPVREAATGFWNMGQENDERDFLSRSAWYQVGALAGGASMFVPIGGAVRYAPKAVQLAYRGRVIAWDAVKSVPAIEKATVAFSKLPSWIQYGAKGAAMVPGTIVVTETARAGAKQWDLYSNKDIDQAYGLTQDQLNSLRTAGYAGQNEAAGNIATDALGFLGMPGASRLTDKGSRGFRKGVVDELTQQGYTLPQANEIAARVQKGAFSYEVAEGAAMLNVNRVSEKLGREILFKEVAKRGGVVVGKRGALSAGLFVGSRLTLPGAQEGAASYYTQKRSRNEKMKLIENVQVGGVNLPIGGFIGYTVAGALTAGTVGGVIGGTPISTNKMIRGWGKTVDVAANTLDPYEKGGDLLADASLRSLKRAGGTVPKPVYGLRPKVITPGANVNILTTQKQVRPGSTFTDINSLMQSKTRTRGQVPSFVDINEFFPSSSKTPTKTTTKITGKTKIPTSIQSYINVPTQVPLPVPSMVSSPTQTPTQVQVPVTVPRMFLPIPPLGSGFSGAFGGKGGKSKKGASRSVFSAFFNIKGGFNQAKYGVEQTGIVLRA